jgi:hypothetical protein
MDCGLLHVKSRRRRGKKIYITIALEVVVYVVVFEETTSSGHCNYCEKITALFFPTFITTSKRHATTNSITPVFSITELQLVFFNYTPKTIINTHKHILRD